MTGTPGGEKVWCVQPLRYNTSMWLTGRQRN